jgi:hypothetical protein
MLSAFRGWSPRFDVVYIFIAVPDFKGRETSAILLSNRQKKIATKNATASLCLSNNVFHLCLWRLPKIREKVSTIRTISRCRHCFFDQKCVQLYVLHMISWFPAAITPPLFPLPSQWEDENLCVCAVKCVYWTEPKATCRPHRNPAKGVS